jgi:hypothetical protein
LNNPADVVIAFFDLLEAELGEIKRLIDESVNLKRGTLGKLIMRLAGSIALIIAAVVLVFAAIALLLWSLYLYISQFMLPTQAVFMTALACFFAAGILIVIARWLNH